MRSLLSLLLILTIICFGCKNENTINTTEKTEIVLLDSLSKEKADIDVLKLSTQTAKDLESFEDFQNLKNLILSLNKSNPFHIKKYADSADLLVQNFKENLSEDLKVNPISSRISVLATESGLLLQLTQKQNQDAQKLMDANIRLLTAYNSLIIQLNELSLAIPEDIEKELLRERDILRDSILNPEEKNIEIEE
ncbi:hypothetical protein D1818_13345 [Aquimarina sp. BL5]|uniref:hypothetical protein n=1 Tax=Aquimarina sp. BL5 TaxID=1714860 RepID=UPI000E4ABF21|nr:hypothetical protein [Aquimarina sp. BL5]AXT51779.1 hypothetical protein D1818_13345 [Aquimarina sp. BL5]RKN11801.1 hypothetical protein D7036_00100 [Aquimarina sp. BL5]